MSKLLSALAAPALLLASLPALAADPAPATTPAPIDPARLAAARQTVDYVFPAGTYARIMNGTLDRMMDSIMDSATSMPLKSLAGMGGVDTSKLGKGTLAEIMEIYDPAYRERMRISTRTMMADMSALMTEFEPEIRDGLSQAYAARFDAIQLGELNAFFATPTGKAYAADSNVIMMSPEVMSKMQTLMPRLMEHMPAIMAKAQAATANLPAQRKYADLSVAEREKLAKLLGIGRGELDKREEEKAGKF
jgi:hypothetical protein